MNQWSNLYLPLLVLVVGCALIGMKDLRKLKVENEKKFGEVDKKTYDAVVGIYVAVYILFFVDAIPNLFDPSFRTVSSISFLRARYQKARFGNFYSMHE